MERIIAQLINHLVVYISSLGYWGILIGMAIESACIPLPSEIIMPFGGYLASKGLLNLYGVALVGALGNLLGSLLAYYVGLKGGRKFLQKYGRYFLFQAKHLDSADKWFAKYGVAAVFFGRLMPGIRTFISLPAGIAVMDIKKFITYSFLGSIPWGLALAFAGYKLGQNWEMVRSVLKRFDIPIVAVVIILLLIFFIRNIRSSSTKDIEGNERIQGEKRK